MNTEKSKNMYEKAKTLIPGGVNSPVRAIKPYPFYTKSAKGSKITDIDGNQYIDYCMAYGPNILGHAHPMVREAIIEQVEKGLIYGTPSVLEVKLAEKINSFYPSIEKMRFVSTGSEATMSSIRLARGFTGKDKIVKIEGGFHGAHDAVLVKAGSGATTHGEPNSPGIPSDVTKNTLQCPFNDAEAFIDLVDNNKDEIAAVIMEPVMGNMGPILPRREFLSAVRSVTQENDILLIFDEVITGCRLALGGAQDYYEIKPDLTTLGKIVGGGMPIGVFGGRSEILDLISPEGPVYQAGTFSGHPVTMAAGLATLNYIEKHEVCRTLNDRGISFRKALSDIAAEKKNTYSVVGVSSMFGVFFGDTPMNYQDALKCDTVSFNKYFKDMLKSGIFVPPSQFETNFLSLAHSTEDFDKTIEAFDSCLE
ncbi:MAG: glutamate-1-semialdehyde 2,1-aminomutase [Methanosarcinaceae archaeon]|nr:glutamate-1-semialdehyde 2,1-aminomutase [Methanosarcinaceae archaeon]